ncbi:MAG: hypothetical protein J5I59_08540 [Saprospiraceae bacterium]|nr:hypothetical protein [Saprospiraceae bacterium]
MKRIVVFGFCILFSFNFLNACDICGCGISASSFGILPRFQGHFIGIKSRYRIFQSYHPPLFPGSEPIHSKEYFYNLDLWARYSVGSRVQFYLDLPYQYIFKREDSEGRVYSGLGDISLLANFMLLDHTDASKFDLMQALQIGTGIKFPTGNTKIPEKDGYIIKNLQPGLGSYAFPINLLYTIRKGIIGFHTELNYQHIFKKDGFQFGDRGQQSVGMYMVLNQKGWTFMPNVGVNYALAAKDRSDGIPYETSGSKNVACQLGMGIYRNSISIGLQTLIPIWQHNVNGYVNNKSDHQLTFLYNF